MDDSTPVALQQEPALFPEVGDRLRGDHDRGILPSQALATLVEHGYISGEPAIEPAQVQPASIDLRLGPVAHRVRASFLPGARASVADKLRELQMHRIDLTRPAVFEKGCVYLVPLVEQLRLPEYTSARANPKSTTGRLDVFARLIADYSNEFDRVEGGYRGPLYLEVVPGAFSVVVRAGDRLNQLRLVRGESASDDGQLKQLHQQQTLTYSDDGVPGPAHVANGLWLSVDLAGADHRTIGYRAKSHAPLVDFGKVGGYRVADFWDVIPRPPQPSLLLNPGDFYILASRERIRIPQTHAAELVPYDASAGEFRIHYAGFFDPGFGEGPGVPGAKAVLEVRAHGVPFVLEDGQRVGRLVYERLTAAPDKSYGPAIGSSYQGQGLLLGKQFARED